MTGMAPAPSMAPAPRMAPAPGPDQYVYAERIEQDSSEDDQWKPERGKEVLDEVMIDAGAIPGATRADFVESGFFCTECGWTTRKKKINGIQALRAHSKKHVRDRRAARNSRIFHIVVLVIGLLVVVSPELVLQSPLAAKLGNIPLEIGVSINFLGVVLAVASGALAVIIVFASDQYVVTGRRKWSRAYKWIERMWIVFFMSAASLMWTDTGQNIPVHWMTSALLPWVASAFVRGSVVKTRIMVVRREFKPQHQLKLLRSKEVPTDSKIRRVKQDIRQRIRDGRIVLSDVTRKQFAYFRGLGLDGVRLDPHMEKKRLDAELRTRQKDEHERLKRESHVQRQRERKMRLRNGSRGINKIQRRPD